MLHFLLLNALRYADKKQMDQTDNQIEFPSSKEEKSNADDNYHLFRRQGEPGMKNVKEVMEQAMQIDGAIAASLVSLESGMALGKESKNRNFNLDVASAGNTEVVQSKLKVMNLLDLKNEKIEDILITLSTQYHLIRLLGSDNSLFLYLALEKDKANLAMARHQLKALEKQVV